MIRDGALAASWTAGRHDRWSAGQALSAAGPVGGEVGTDLPARRRDRAAIAASLYTFWKRTSPPPAMLTFDATTREVCAVKRQTTATPLQALVLLNDPQFVEAARAPGPACLPRRRLEPRRPDHVRRPHTDRPPTQPARARHPRSSLSRAVRRVPRRPVRPAQAARSRRRPARPGARPGRMRRHDRAGAGAPQSRRDGHETMTVRECQVRRGPPGRLNKDETVSVCDRQNQFMASRTPPEMVFFQFLGKKPVPCSFPLVDRVR